MDLAVVTVPREAVLQVARECGEAGVKALVVISAGFREVGPEGAERERRLVEIVREHGMRLVGPNCMGLLSTEPGVSLNATFAPTAPPPGPISFMSQSGALGVTILDYAAEYGIGIRQFVSVGNKADVSGNDLLEYWEEDEGTRVILMYLENFGNPRRFTRIARRITRSKPICVVKSGRTLAGARAASSHTGALASVDVATDALLSQCGVLRADTVGELFDVAMAFGTLPMPRGNRVAIVTNAGGPGIITADACEAGGLEVVELGPETQGRLREIFPAEASVRNPVDMIATATAESYRVALDVVLDDPRVDAAIAAFVPPLGVRQTDVANAIQAAGESRREKPILAVLMGREGLPQGRAELQEAGIPAYIFPESAARSLAALDRHRRWLARPVEEPETFEVDEDGAARVLDGAREVGRAQLTEPEAYRVLEAFGIPVVEHRLATSGPKAAAAARSLGLPVVLKAVSPEIVHKSEAGAVRVGLESAEDVEKAYEEMTQRLGRERPEAEIPCVLVCRHESPGTETIVGMSTHPGFGPVLMFGLGGIYVEALRDVTFRVQPVTRPDAREMIEEIRAHPLLEGVRGGAGVDQGLLVEVIQRVSQLVGTFPRIRELEMNPFLARADGGMALDARIRLVESE
ncbi:MAG: CoA-binding protein [Gemmatimonadetes bacterium]|nr:CoA-binding protein [Gemmatimonadota bacterium]NIR79209.1 CoA-binding protein [Gemmatimonadota bacterium]NIT87870.1 CoA-binding protein [Gemmatimonadota bacterium]NIU31725.1 CoA-binding protein [Gemmatimonadota bacterium]NIU36342.1 CoA-binding protein [Gemmatimonadota bacterium]